MFDGRDYHHQFEEMVEEWHHISEADDLRRKFERLEWVLEEAIRSSFALRTNMATLILIVVLSFVLDLQDAEWPVILLYLGALLAFWLTSYWLSRLAFWHEVTRHIQGRKFGQINWPKN